MNFLTELLRRPPITWWDAVDIVIVSILVYELLKLIRGTRAVQMAVGIASIVGLYYLSTGLQLETLNWLIRNIIGYVVFAAIVLLQADIRRALVHLGRGRLFRRFEGKSTDDDTVEELVVAATTLSSRWYGCDQSRSSRSRAIGIPRRARCRRNSSYRLGARSSCSSHA